MKLDINLNKNMLSISKKITSQENIKDSISCDLINNFLNELNKQPHNTVHYGDSTIIEYVQRKLFKLLWGNITKKQNQFVNIIDRKIKKFPLLKESLDTIIHTQEEALKPQFQITSIKKEKKKKIKDRETELSIKKQDEETHTIDIKDNITPAQLIEHSTAEFDQIYDRIAALKEQVFTITPHALQNFNKEIQLFWEDMPSHDIKTNFERLSALERAYILIFW